LQLDPHLVGLHLLQVQWADLRLMNTLSLASGPMLPGHDRPLIQSKGRDNSLAAHPS
jgi:hypothetical protein